MKTYLVVTGVAFALLFLAHVARVAVEGWQVAASATFIVTTLGALAIAAWAFHLYRSLRSSGIVNHGQSFPGRG